MAARRGNKSEAVKHVAAATAILEDLKQKVKVLELEPAGGGCFEVAVDGREIWSKLKTGQFPDPKDQAKVRQGLDMAAQIREDAGLSEGQAWRRPS